MELMFWRSPKETWDRMCRRMERLGTVSDVEGELLAAMAGWMGVSGKIHPEWRKIDRLILKVVAIMERDRRRDRRRGRG